METHILYETGNEWYNGIVGYTPNVYSADKYFIRRIA